MQCTCMTHRFHIYRSRLVHFVRGNDPSPHMIALPYGGQRDQMTWPLDRHHLSSVVQRIVYTLKAYAVMHPRARKGYEIYPVLGPSFKEVSEIKQMIAEGKRHIFAYFCLKGELSGATLYVCIIMYVYWCGVCEWVPVCVHVAKSDY